MVIHMDFIFLSRRCLTVCFLVNIFLLNSTNVNAEECGVIQIQQNRSSGVSIKGNNCKEFPYISIGTNFDLSAKGRLWVKSNPSAFLDSEFQMICQNRTGSIIQLQFADTLPPWLSQAKLNNCSGWTDNKLSCEGQNGEKNGIYCVLTFYKSVPENKIYQIDRTTSVKMRSMESLQKSYTNSIQSTKKQTIEAIKPEISLCKKLNQINQEIKINWTVLNREVKEVEIILMNKQIDGGWSECFESVISTFSYPNFPEKVTFNTTF
jgi:hypothetical protein